MIEKNSTQQGIKGTNHPTELLFEYVTQSYENGKVTENWLSIRNESSNTHVVQDVPSIVLELPEDVYELLYFTSTWGHEFQPVRKPLTTDLILRNGTGRSSHGLHPWFTLFGSDGRVVTGTVMFSGNWAIQVEPYEDGVRIRAGLDPSVFSRALAPGESMETPHVAIAYGESGDLNETSLALARVSRKHWLPVRRDGTDSLSVEWNHWWVYEDRFINEEVFRKNVDVASWLGIELCTLDAGWFGPNESEANWFDVRGDWDLVNESRFPSGLKALSDYTHKKGMKFGLWCEIEALGSRARVAVQHPDFQATLDGESLGYVCFGNPNAQAWAFGVLDRLIQEYNCDWIKLDFNLDPMAGCNRTDHGHGHGYGLFEHYTGYYNVLDKIRAKHPNVVLENCASGGLRIDLGILRHTHTTFLSDPDWPDHNLQVFWGATTMLPAEYCLHWANSEWCGDNPNQTFRADDESVKHHELDFYVHSAMLGGLGFSQRLPDMPQWMLERYKANIQVYKDVVRPMIRTADLYRLTDMPQRDRTGARWVAFQYASGTGLDTGQHQDWAIKTNESRQPEHLLFVFRLPGAEQNTTIRLRSLVEETTYEVSCITLEELSEGTTLAWTRSRIERLTGRELMEQGLVISNLSEMESALIELHSVS